MTEQPSTGFDWAAAQRRYGTATFMVLTALHGAAEPYMTPKGLRELAESNGVDLSPREVYSALVVLEQNGLVGKVARGHYVSTVGQK